MNARVQDFVQRYRDGFDAYLHDRDEHALSGAYQLGRSAVGDGLSTLDLAAAHQEVLLERLGAGRDSTAVEDVVRAAGDFFLESVSAFEVVRRALQDARETARLERRHATILRNLSTFLADASLALDASDSMGEMLQLVAEHARELTGAERGTARVTVDDDRVATISATAAESTDPALEAEINALSALYQAVAPPGGSLRLSSAELERHRAHHALAELAGAAWKPHGWLVAPITALDGRNLGLIQVFDKPEGDFSELDEALLVQLAQMASAAVERAQLYRAAR